MNHLDELTQLGYVVSFSAICPIFSWGQWYIGVKTDNGPQFNAYGLDEVDCFTKVIDRIKQYKK